MIYKLEVPGPVEDVEEVRVLEWQKGVDHAFASGDLIVELETHKAVIEIRAAQPGVLRRILCEAGNWQKIGEPLAMLSDEAGEPLPDAVERLPVWLIDFEIS